MIEGRVVYSNMNGFSGNLFAISVCYLEVGDVGSGMVVGYIVFLNCTGDVTVVFFNSIFQKSSGLSYAGKVTIFLWA